MGKNIQIVLFITIFTGCYSETKIEGNWGFCDKGEYSEVYINDTTFRFYFSDIGFTSMVYTLENTDIIYLFDASNELKLKGKILDKGENRLLIRFIEHETNEVLIFDLKKFKGNNSIANSTNIDDYYEWLNKEFIPEFEKRKTKFNCSDK